MCGWGELEELSFCSFAAGTPSEMRVSLQLFVRVVLFFCNRDVFISVRDVDRAIEIFRALPELRTAVNVYISTFSTKWLCVHFF